MLNSTTIGFANRIYNTVLNEGGNNTIAGIIAAQAAHETGGFTSSLFKRANNAFGMTIPHIRQTPYIVGSAGQQPDGSGNYAVYNSIEDSTKDLINWLQYNKIDYNNIHSINDYTIDLKSKGYYGDTQANYSSNMSYYYNQIVNFLKASTPFAAVFAIIVLAFAFLYFKK